MMGLLSYGPVMNCRSEFLVLVHLITHIASYYEFFPFWFAVVFFVTIPELVQNSSIGINIHPVVRLNEAKQPQVIFDGTNSISWTVNFITILTVGVLVDMI